MLKVSWILVVSFVGVVLDVWSTFPTFQIFFSAVALFFLTVQFGFKTATIPALFIGGALDSYFAHDFASSTLANLIVILPTALLWKKHGDCQNINLSIVPILFIILGMVSFKIMFSNLGGHSWQHYLFLLIYILESVVATSLLGILLLSWLNKCSEKLRLPKFESMPALRGN